jgi:5-methyltetrahydrofolate--homocysteine methyltransferase
MNTFESLLSSRPYLLADGAMGTMLMAAGLDQGQAPETWNLSHPASVRDVHRSYIQAGSDILLTNSFGGTRFRLKLHGLQDRVSEFNRVAAQLARAEAEAAGRPVAVAGSMGPSGELFEPMGTLNFQQAREAFAEQAAGLVEGGVEVLWIETMSDLQEVQAAVMGARDAGDLPVVTTMTFDTNGRTMMGVTPVQALEAMRELGSVALGGNCGNGPAEIEGVIEAMHRADPTATLVAKSNAGIPEYVKGELVYSGTPEVMARHAVHVRNLGARIIGACCGSTPDHVKAMAEALAAAPIEPIDVSTGAKSGAEGESVRRSRGRRQRRRREV